jgi:hypothetical protein
MAIAVASAERVLQQQSAWVHKPEAQYVFDLLQK